ncbi:uncharacterized protein LOC127599747 [Hippocampus zosterae]|uniref:uncharacterized protein LOC127599747 n=1 Tax=Hippocampus zosterae TaxID=109293 RepID=UPI00223D09DA|nr:uncharacterized protein LOC127599747 [Hippocampus zosterae]
MDLEAFDDPSNPLMTSNPTDHKTFDPENNLDPDNNFFKTDRPRGSQRRPTVREPVMTERKPATTAGEPVTARQPGDGEPEAAGRQPASARERAGRQPAGEREGVGDDRKGASDHEGPSDDGERASDDSEGTNDGREGAIDDRVGAGNSHPKNMNFQPFEDIDYKPFDPENNFDPDNNFFNNKQRVTNSDYYLDEQFNTNIKLENALSVIHLNSRSLYKNFTKIKEYLTKFNKFKIIAISETWLDEDKTTEMEIEGYEMFATNREKKKGGGVAIYVDKALKCSKIERLTNTIENLMECLTIEIHNKKASNIIISCIYRTPGTCINTFNKKLTDMLSYYNDKKTRIIGGDFNIDLLNPNRHKKTTDFINTMYSNSFFPVILKPSRITVHTATLIDNIFINKIDHKMESGLLINDISDHLPVFAVFHNYFDRKAKSTTRITEIRLRTQRSIDAFKQDLEKQNWTEVYSNEDPNTAFEVFQSTIISLYDKHFPLTKVSKKYKDPSKPWITKGIENACKKKNNLYKLFLKIQN